MTAPRIVRLYLYPDLRRRVQERRRGFLTTLCHLLGAQGWEVYLRDNTQEELEAARTRSGYSVVRMIAPPNARGVTFRKTYYAPFWHLERSADRWTWPVAQAPFDPSSVNPQKAARLVARMRSRHLANVGRPSREGFVLVALQGQLRERRSFQSATPLQMVESVLSADPVRKIVATLHPRERYHPEDLRALDTLARRFPRLSVQSGGSDALLAGCDYVVTQTSSVALAGYFLEKPAVLFGRIDFHHIAANVHDMGMLEALRHAPDMRPDFAAYLWWFFRVMAIDDSRPDAEARIAQALIRAGWPLRPV